LKGIILQSQFTIIIVPTILCFIEQKDHLLLHKLTNGNKNRKLLKFSKETLKLNFSDNITQKQTHGKIEAIKKYMQEWVSE